MLSLPILAGEVKDCWGAIQYDRAAIELYREAALSAGAAAHVECSAAERADLWPGSALGNAGR